MLRRRIIFVACALLFVILPVIRAQDLIPIGYGDTVRGQITDPSQGVLYVFDGQRGETITVTLNSDEVDVYLRLGDMNGNLLAENDDITRTNLNAAIEFELPTTGQYVVAALGYETGPYILSLQGSSSGTQVNNTSTLSYGDSASGQAVSLDTPVLYTFIGRAGDRVAISLSSDEVDTYLVLADSSGNTVAENDDISQTNYNSFVEAVLPASGEYLIGVFAYESGPFALTLDTSTGTGGETQPITNNDSSGEVFTGEINSTQYYVEVPILDVSEGDVITIEARATSGDLDVYIGLFYGDEVVAENDDRDQSTTDSFLEYPRAAAGDYSLVITRYGFQEGATSGEFEASIKVGSGGSTIITTTTTSNPIAAGYPTLPVTPSIADWTVLVYMGGDNNLEDGLENDLDEFERAGGSTESVRILALFDRSHEYSTANDNWTETRIYEPGPDETGDFRTVYPPTIDSTPLADLGELDTTFGNNLLDFLVWGIQTYPARHYAVIMNDHGGAWYGTVTDETTGSGILDIPTMSQVFDAALKNTGLEKFDLLINDACLMSGIEHYAAMARYFDFALGSPEITLNPSFDMELMTNVLNDNPNIDIGQLGKLMVDKYMQDMGALAPDTVPVLGAVITDLRGFDGVVNALDNFTEVVTANPAAYVSEIGQVRANTYAYSFFLPEDQFGPATNIDIGDFMLRVARSTTDTQLSSAAQGVLNSLSQVRLYSNAGTQLARFSTFYNIYFPARSYEFDTRYFEQTPLQDWALMLRSFFGGASPQSRSFRGPQGAPAAAPSSVPIVNITNIFPDETSVAIPITISMEVTGRNISEGKFTVDQIQPDGSAIRLESSRIVTEVVNDGVVEYVNLWNPGVDDSDFTWDSEVPFISNGTLTSTEQVVSSDGVSSIAGRYHYPGQEDWIDVTVIFNSDGGTSSVVSRRPGSNGLASITLVTGGEFQPYRLRVTPDGQVVSEPGSTFIWPEEGITWEYAPAPTGQYNLGFLVEAVGGTTGFASTTVRVNNDDVDVTLRGYVDDDWGFIMQRPEDWFSVSYFPDADFLQTSDLDATEYIFVYPVYDTENDLQAIAEATLGRYDLAVEGKYKAIKVDGKDALEFNFSYTNDTGTFISRAFAIYVDYLNLGLVFSSEALDPANTDANYQLLVDQLTFFNAEEVDARDTGTWTRDTYTDASRYPVPEEWMPGAEDGLFWYYHPNDDPSDPVTAAVTVLTNRGQDAPEILDILIEQELVVKKGYSQETTETYYGELNTWESVTYTYNGQGGQIRGQMYVTVKDDIPYVLLFEAPTEAYAENFRQFFTIMLDGFKIDDAE